MKAGDEVKVISKQAYTGKWFGNCGLVVEVVGENTWYPYFVDFGDGSSTWPFGEDELENLTCQD